MSNNHSSSNCGCNCGSNCDNCAQTNPCAPKCKAQITTAELGELVYISGLDINLCKKYSTIIDALGLNDCLGNPITASTNIVTCAQFQTQFCTLLTALTLGAPIAAGTVLIGADCLKHVMPAIQGPITVLDTSTIDLTLTAGNVLSGVVKVSDDIGNIIEIHANGIYANLCTGITALPVGTPAVAGTVLVGADCLKHAFPAFQVPITVADTSCLDLTLVNGVLSGVPVVSPSVGNQLTCITNGLFVQAPVVLPEVPITVIDSTTINFTTSGQNDHTLTGNVNVSDDVGQSLIINAEGLYVPSVCTQFQTINGIATPASATDIFVTRDCLVRTMPVNGGLSVLDTVTVDMTLTNTGVVSSNVNVSSVPDNVLTIRPDGLAVRCTDIINCIPAVNVQITATDTNCLDLNVVESPNNTFVISGSPKLSATAGNQVSCTTDGLFVAPQGAPVIAPITNGFPNGCNGLVQQANGLAAPPNSTGNFGEVTLGNFFIENIPLTNGQVVSSQIITVNISNPSTCREAILVLDMLIPAVSFQSSINFGSLQINGNHLFNLPGILVTALSSYTVFNVIGSTTTNAGTPPSERLFIYKVPPGFTGSYSIQWNVIMINGSSNSVYVGNIGTRYWLYTI